MIAEFVPTFFLIIGFMLGYVSCMLWQFFLECREDWRKDNE